MPMTRRETTGEDTEVMAGEGPGGLPDLLSLDLEGLRTVQHPVLDEVLAELCSRIERPTEMLWGFTNAF
jgi:FXSXX-COOH protein